jgi:hypothetical protein
VDWDYVLGESRDLKLADGGHRTLLYAWEPHCEDESCIGFRDVSQGRLDGYLEQVAASMKQFPYDIYVRPWAEMNAPWSPYEPGTNGPRAGTVEEFKQAWRHLYDFFWRRGVENLRFVFNVDVTEEPGTIPIEQIWPGTDPEDGHGYVDVLGMDGYNWGESGIRGGDRWQEFEELFRDSYRTLTKLDAHSPVWVCEFGSKEPIESDGTAKSPAPKDSLHDKGKWIQRMFASREFPRMTALAYYSAYLPGHDNQRDFRLDSSKGSLSAVRGHLQSHGRAAVKRAPRQRPARERSGRIR